MKGAKRILSQHHPLLIFEFGNGASEFYKAEPAELYEFLEQLNYGIYTLDQFIENRKPLTKKEYKDIYNEGSDYYFVARSN